VNLMYVVGPAVTGRRDCKNFKSRRQWSSGFTDGIIHWSSFRYFCKYRWICEIFLVL